MAMKRPAASPPARQAPLKRPAAVPLEKGALMRPAAAKEPAMKRPAAVQKQPEFLRASAVIKKGEIVFEEKATVAVQSARSPEEHAHEQPLFCANCYKPCGAPCAALALTLNANIVSRKELMEVASNLDGESEQLNRWIAFATKVDTLPETFCSPSSSSSSAPSCELRTPSPAVTKAASERGIEIAEIAFDTASCREAWLQRIEPGGLDVPLQKQLGEEKDLVLALLGEWIAKMKGHEDLTKVSEDLIGSVQTSKDPPSAPDCAARAASTFAKELPPKLSKKLATFFDAFSWRMSGDVLPSPLSAYCEAVCKSEASADRTKALKVLAPAVATLQSQLDEVQGDSDDEEKPQDGAQVEQDQDANLKLILPSPEAAQKTEPYFIPKLFSDEEIDLVKSLSEELASKEHRKHAGSSQWRTRYLHAAGFFKERAPELMEKLKKAALEADLRDGGFGFCKTAPDVQLLPRVVEHHLVEPGGGLPDPTHFDGGSLLTIDVMLQKPNQDFEGGTFCTLEADGSHKPHFFDKGDALVFLSHKAHFVQPVTSGFRQTLVMELWEGDYRRCDHRCTQRTGVCPMEATSSAVDDSALDGSSLDSMVETLDRDAATAFASTSFDGIAFFPQLAKVMAQSAAIRSSSSSMPNVEVCFENPYPLATLRATQDLKAGEVFQLADQNGDDDEDDDEDLEEEEGAEEEEEDMEEDEEED
eukprot:CAMPEP_0206435762 /NCGR_PEP_ID=MMETSP0324_2-20121206/10074_1 /ASSEMBLY_ACC=CAM_ASM_000836 /TAXON_ID=2866 /ORGANISM="Crypthecodinium cohnii, Strain Seligo" /LENGTH=701 /DNA_ID=CAMNT_0053902785 /DNA_START=18 /DNA_END=2123 /DNA_ORIENTATION=-